MCIPPALRTSCALWVCAISGKGNYSQRELLIPGYRLADWEPFGRAHTVDPRYSSQVSHQETQSHSAAQVPADLSSFGITLWAGGDVWRVRVWVYWDGHLMAMLSLSVRSQISPCLRLQMMILVVCVCVCVSLPVWTVWVKGGKMLK